MAKAQRTTERAPSAISWNEFQGRVHTYESFGRAIVAAALKQARLERVFDGMAFTHRKEYINAITEAKKPETRQRRIDSMLAALRERSG